MNYFYRFDYDLPISTVGQAKIEPSASEVEANIIRNATEGEANIAPSAADEEVNNDPFDPLIFHVYVHNLADKYGVPELERLAAAKFKAAGLQGWTKPEFADAIVEAYAAPDRRRELRDAVIAISHPRAKILFEHLNGARFREVTKTIPAFGGELAAMLATNVMPTTLKREASPVVEEEPGPGRWCNRRRRYRSLML